MKKIVLLFFLIAVLSSCLFAQAPGWAWARKGGGSGDEYTTGVVADASGNVYVAGNYSASFTLGSTTLNFSGIYDVFLAKYDAAGNVLWAVGAGGNSRDELYGIAIDASNNVYITGHFNSNSITFGTTTLTNAGGSDMFLVKYNSAGTMIWAKREGGSISEAGNGVATDATGHVYVTGFFNSPSVTFGSTTLTNSSSNEEIFVVKYDSSGAVVWAKKAGGTGVDEGYGIAVDHSGNVFVCGTFTSTTMTFASNVLTNAGGYDVFIAKYDAFGNVLWGHGAGGTAWDWSLSVAADAGGNAYMTGWYGADTITFGSVNLLNRGSDDIFLVKYTPTGTVAWAKGFGGIWNEEGRVVVADATGIYLTGSFSSSPMTFGYDTIYSPGNSLNIFAAKFDASGNAQWAKSAGGGGTSEGFGICRSIDSSTYVTGYYLSSSISFDTITLAGAAGDDFFIARLATPSPSFINESSEANAITVYPNPAHNILNVECNTSTPFNAAELRIYDMTGRMVHEQKLNSPLSTVNCPVSTGLYLVRVGAGEKIYQQKLIIE